MTTTICLLVSRDDHLDKMFAALELLRCDPSDTCLLVIVDGAPGLYVQTRNFTEQSKFAARLCIQYLQSVSLAQFQIQERRLRISAIKNWSKQHIPDCQYVMGLEDDSVPPPGALERLLRGYSQHQFAGFISGVQLGRHGLPHVGAWKANDVYVPTLISSLMPGEGLQEVDAAGWYCYLTKREHYMRSDYKPFDGNQLGPDLQWGLELRRQGLSNYVDWDLKIEHLTRHTRVTFGNTVPKEVRILKAPDKQWKVNVIV